jgi:SulP family sulfate permease
MPLFTNLPDATLGAVVIAAMMGLLNFDYFRQVRRLDRQDFYLSMAAFWGELLLGILAGVALGVILSLLAMIRWVSQPPTAVLGKMPGEDVFRDVTRHPEATTFPGLLIYGFDAALGFPNANYFASSMRRYIAESKTPIRMVLINATPINDTDTTSSNMLSELDRELAAQDIVLAFARLRDPIRDDLKLAGVETLISTDWIFDSVDDGVAAYQQHVQNGGFAHDMSDGFISV